MFFWIPDTQTMTETKAEDTVAAVDTARFTSRLWSALFQPRILDDICGQVDLVRMLREMVEGEWEHALIHGPAGVGKTAATSAAAHESFPTSVSANVLFLNASDQRGVAMIEKQVLPFVAGRALEKTAVRKRLVVLDEADALSMEAQRSLVGLMQAHRDTCAVICICNDALQVSQGIRAEVGERCMRVEPPREGDVCAYLLRIIQRTPSTPDKWFIPPTELVEKVVAYVKHSGMPDLRACLHHLQSAVVLLEDEHVPMERRRANVEALLRCNNGKGTDETHWSTLQKYINDQAIEDVVAFETMVEGLISEHQGNVMDVLHAWLARASLPKHGDTSWGSMRTKIIILDTMITLQDPVSARKPHDVILGVAVAMACADSVCV